MAATKDRIFVERLLSEVQGYPCIFAIGQEDYKDIRKKENAWETIASRLNCNPKVIQKRFKSLRDVYVKKKKKQVKKSGTEGPSSSDTEKWPYFEQMSFLNQHMKDYRTHGNIGDSEMAAVPSDGVDGEGTSTNPSSSSTTESSESATVSLSSFRKKVKRKRDEEIDEELLKILKESSGALQSKENESLLWAKSISLRLDKLSPLQRAQVRVRVENILLEVEFPSH